MGLNVVVDGAKLNCSKCTTPNGLTLKVSTNSTVMVENKKVATNLDISQITGPAGKTCTSQKNPVYLANVAAKVVPPGPNPCMAKVVPWDPVSKSVSTNPILGLKALNADSECKCAYTLFDGVISIGDPGTKKTTID